VAVPTVGEASQWKVNAVIYATDLSVCCQNVGFYAAFLAKHFSAELIVAHAFTISQAAMEVEIDPGLVSEQRKDLEFLLSRKAAKLSRDGVRASSALLEGDPRKVLVAFADKHAPSMIVLGTHGGGWIEREIIGSVAEGLLRSTSWPLLTVGPQVKSGAARDLRFKHILCATDFTPAAARAATYAVHFAEVFEKTWPERAPEFSHPSTFVEVGDAHHRILQHIKDHAVDLLVLGIQKTSHLGITVRNSGTFQLILAAICPVLTIVG
jgi:nucleotide-binding universal stress UspA family protein